MIEFTLGHKLARTIDILTQAVNEHHPVAVIAALSGGHDSIVVTDIMYRWLRRSAYAFKIGTLAIRTGLAADGWERLIEAMCYCGNYTGLEFAEGKGREWYSQNVAEFGFGFTPGHHVTYYRMLKQEAIRSHMKQTKLKRRDRVLYVTGVRRSESLKRQSTADVIRSGSRVTVNAIAHWEDEDIERYTKALLPWYHNPYYELHGTSGDCFCGWTHLHRIADFDEESPELASYLHALNAKQVESGSWQYGEVPELDSPSPSQSMPADSLCVNCMVHDRPNLM